MKNVSVGLVVCRVSEIDEVKEQDKQGKERMDTLFMVNQSILFTAVILMVVLGAIYIKGRERNKKRVLAFKAAATLVADVLAVVTAIHQGTPAAWCVAVGIFLYACADILLEIKFIWGIVCFGIGHLWVMAGIGMEGMNVFVTALVFVLLYGIALGMFYPDFGKLKQLKIPGLIYAALLCMMCAATFGAAFACSTAWNWARAAGGICFVVSDAIIAKNFVKRSRSRLSGIVLMVLYYTAVFLLGAAGI